MSGTTPPSPTHFLPAADVRRRPVESMTDEELRVQAVEDLAAAVNAIWAARIRLGALLVRGHPVKGAYAASVRASEACDRAIARAPKRRLAGAERPRRAVTNTGSS